MLQGLRTAIYHAADIAAARDWYARALGLAPYFDEPFYVGFNVGGYELGLDSDVTGFAPGTQAVAYWGVPDIAAAYAHWLGCGAVGVSGPQEVGGGISVAQVADPFGNFIGLIENPHFTLS